MKRIIVCYVCKKPKKFDMSYAVKVQDYSGDFIEEVFKNGKETIGRNWIVEPKKARICRTCTKRLGYKVRNKI